MGRACPARRWAWSVLQSKRPARSRTLFRCIAVRVQTDVPRGTTSDRKLPYHCSTWNSVPSECLRIGFTEAAELPAYARGSVPVFRAATARESLWPCEPPITMEIGECCCDWERAGYARPLQEASCRGDACVARGRFPVTVTFNGVPHGRAGPPKVMKIGAGNGINPSRDREGAVWPFTGRAGVIFSGAVWPFGGARQVTFRESPCPRGPRIPMKADASLPDWERAGHARPLQNRSHVWPVARPRATVFDKPFHVERFRPTSSRPIEHGAGPKAASRRAPI